MTQAHEAQTRLAQLEARVRAGDSAVTPAQLAEATTAAAAEQRHGQLTEEAQRSRRAAAEAGQHAAEADALTARARALFDGELLEDCRAAYADLVKAIATFHTTTEAYNAEISALYGPFEKLKRANGGLPLPGHLQADFAQVRVDGRTAWQLSLKAYLAAAEHDAVQDGPRLVHPAGSEDGVHPLHGPEVGAARRAEAERTRQQLEAWQREQEEIVRVGREESEARARARNGGYATTIIKSSSTPRSWA